MGSPLNLQGQRLGRLIVLECVGVDKYHNRMWKCKCDCGGYIITTANILKRGKAQSCGCLQKEKAAMQHYRHGQYKSRLYGIWEEMKRRCKDKKCWKYQYYGGKGIAVCNTWDEDYLSFAEWALKHGYSDNLSIDRIDNNKGYSPDNCRWATKREQARNRSNNVLITYNGKTQILVEWCEELNLPYSLMQSRIKKGWTAERAFTTPKLNTGRRKLNCYHFI